MKTLMSFLIALVFSLNCFAADNLIGDGKSGNFQLIDNSHNRWNVQVAYTTNGSGDVFTLGGLSASTDNYIGDLTSGNHLLVDNAGKRWQLSVFYTTDGNGNVIPITGGGGGSSAWGSITGTLSNQTDLQSALNAKQASLGYTAENVALKGATNGYAGLDSGGTVPLAQLPLAVKDPSYRELHVYGLYAGATSTGAYNQPYKSLQTAVNAAQSLGVNAVIFLHDSLTENVVVNNYTNNLTIQAFGGGVIDATNITLNGNITISGTSTRIRLKDFVVQYPGGTQPDLIDTSAGRNYATNVQFNGGGGVQYSGSWARWHEFVDCSIVGPVSIAGTPAANSTISTFRLRGSAAFTVNAANASLSLFDSASFASVTHSNGNLIIDGGRGFTGAGIISTANSPSLLSVLNFTMQINGSTSFATINKTGTAPYQLSNVWRNEAADVLTGTRLGFGATSADETYVPTTASNWSTAPTNVKDGLDKVVTLQQSASGSQPACSSTHRGLQWLIQGGAGVADIYQVCQKDATDTYVWTTH